MDNWKAQFVHYFHILCILLLLFGSLLPVPLIYIHIIAIPIVIAHWHFNNGQCVLTQLEERLSTKPKKKDAVEGDFTRGLFRKFGIEINEFGILIVSYGLLTLSGILSILKVW